MTLPNLYRICTTAKYQLVGVLAFSVCVAWALWKPQYSSADISSLDRATFLGYLGALATLLALFCSISLAWVLFAIQRDNSERVGTYDLLKSRLHQAQQWLLLEPPSEDRELCLALVWEFDKLSLSELPVTDWGEEYREYTQALDKAFGDANASRRHFYTLSASHFGYIEELLSRIGVISIRQVISGLFVQTLGKGFAIVSAAILVMVCASLWFGEFIKPWLVLATTVISVCTTLLFLEVFVDIRRMHHEALEFIDSDEDNGEA